MPDNKEDIANNEDITSITTSITEGPVYNEPSKDNKTKANLSTTTKVTITDADGAKKPFDINKVTNVTDIEEIANNIGTYRPIKAKDTIGDGILDRLLETVRLNLDAQRKSGRIRQEEYAQAYVALTQAAIQAAVQLALQGDIAAMQVAKEAEQIATYQRQRIAYDEDFLVKATSHLMDSYIAFLTSMPNVDDQKYPLMFTGNGTITDFKDNTSNKDRLSLMDGVMSRLYKRIETYQKDQFHD